MTNVSRAIHPMVPIGHPPEPRAAWMDPRALRASAAPNGLRRIFEDTGYIEAAVEGRVAAGVSQGGPDLPFLRRSLAGDDGLDRLIRLFCLGDALPDRDCLALLGPDLSEELLRLELLETTEHGLRATLMIGPFQGLWVASDFPEYARPGALDGCYVPGVSSLSETLVKLAIRRPVETALDIGTGMGIQAFAAARHARRVIGTDVNPRALACATLGAQLNGISNVEWREGSFFEPVDGERFDLIVANPPFVVSPERRYLFRDGDVQADGVAELVVCGTARHLAPGGFGVVAFNWHHGEDGDWAARPRRWVEGAGCDAWLVRFESLHPLAYAALWLRQTDKADPRRYGDRLDTWTRHYQRLRIEAFALGAIVLRRRAGGENWFRTTTAQGEALGDACSEHIESVFEAEDLLESLPDEESRLGLRLEVHPDHVLERCETMYAGQRTTTSLRLRRLRGVPAQGDVDEPVVGLLTACDGRRTLAEVAEGLAAELRLDVGSARASVLKLAEALLRSGVLRAFRPANED